MRSLDAFCIPVEVLMHLTALERLDLEEMDNGAGHVSLSALQQLTLLRLNRVEDSDLAAIAGCSNLQALCLGSELLLNL